MEDGSPWLSLFLYLCAFLVAYFAVVVAFAGIYLEDFKDVHRAIHYSIDTLVDRGRIGEDDLSRLGRDWSCVEAIIGHIFPGVAFGLLFAALPLRK
jgi:hypothetical protein